MRDIDPAGKGHKKRSHNLTRPPVQTPGSAAPIGPESAAVELRARLRPWRWGDFAAPRSMMILLTTYAVSLIFLVFGPYVNFGHTGGVDCWFYTGFFMNSSYMLRQYGVTYYFSRLPWTIPGLIAFKIATPVVASVLLNGAIVTVSAVSLYWIIRWHFGHVPALLASIALGTNLYFIYTVMWDYPDGPAIAYALVALACYLRPHGNKALNSILAACFLALSGFTNMAGGAMIVAMLLIPFWQHRRSLKELVAEGVYIAIGVGGATVPLCLASKLILGRYWFFRYQVDQALYEYAHPGYLSNMWGTGLGFLTQAHRLFLPMFLLILCGLLLVARKCGGIAWPSYLFASVYCALIVMQEFVFHAVALRVAYHSSYMIVPLFLLAGIALGEIWKLAGEGRRWTMKPELSFCRSITFGSPQVAAALVAVFGIALPCVIDGWKPAMASRAAWTAMAILGAVTIIVAISLRRWGVPAVCLVSVLILAAIYIGPAYDPALQYPRSRENADTFQSLMEVQHLLMAGVDQQRHLRFWFDKDERLAPLFDSAASLYLWGYVDLTKELPGASPDTVRSNIQPNTTLVHLVSQLDRVGERGKLLKDLGIAVGNERRWTVPSSGGRFYVVLEDVTDMSGVR